MIKVKHTAWETENVEQISEYTYNLTNSQPTIKSLGGNLFLNLFKLQKDNTLLSIVSQRKYEPTKFKEEKTKDVLGVNVIVREGFYQVNEEDLEIPYYE